MDAPWTRDATVRAYVVTMAPEVSGRIVELPVHDNQLVHKGDLLMVIDPTNYEIAVKSAEAAVEQDEGRSPTTRRRSRSAAISCNNLAVSDEIKQTFRAQSLSADATHRQAIANLEQARVNLERTRIVVPGQRLCHQPAGADTATTPISGRT